MDWKKSLAQAAPELIDIGTRTKTPKQAMLTQLKTQLKNKLKLDAANPI